MPKIRVQKRESHFDMKCRLCDKSRCCGADLEPELRMRMTLCARYEKEIMLLRDEVKRLKARIKKQNEARKAQENSNFDETGKWSKP
jgi:uncharacterized small protein (DUF1192 family)